MVRSNYSKLTSKQKLEIIEYWSKFHYPYATICDHFKSRWNREVNASTVADIIQQWKKKKTIRGVTKVSHQQAILLACIKETLHQVAELGFSISKQSLHAICLGELADCEVDSSSCTFESIETLLQDNQISLTSYFSDTSVNNSELCSLQQIQEIIQSSSPSSILFLVSFSLFFRCLPYKQICYPLDLSNSQFRERMEIITAFSLDGSMKTPLYIIGRRFISQIQSDWSIQKKKKKREQLLMTLSVIDIYNYLSWLDQSLTSKHVVFMEDYLHFINHIEINPSTGNQIIHFQTIEKESPPNLPLQHLQLFLVNSHLFTSICPFNLGIQQILIKSYRSQLIQELIHLQHNNRGYKRILPIDTCYRLLSSCWNEIPADVILDCAYQSKCYESLSTDCFSLYYQQVEVALSQSIQTFNQTFKINQLELLTTSSYSLLEIIPYIAGVSSIHECIRNNLPLVLFNHNHYPISPSFPEPEYFLKKAEMKEEEMNECLPLQENQSLISIPEIERSTSSSLFQPSTEVVNQFCLCLESFLHSSSFSEEERLYYSTLIERIHDHYCKLSCVC